MKKLLLGLSLLFTSGFFLSGITYTVEVNSPNQAVAEKKEKAKVDEKKISDELKMYENLGQGLYAITWPLLVISGQAMTNDFIYGSFIGMDVLLWKIWNVIRTFANYIIGLVLIFSIFISFFGAGKFEQFNPIKVIPQLVISALLVNASWFIIEVCLDISTILTYQVGTLPLQVGIDKLDLGKKPIPTFSIKFQNSKDKVILIGVKDGKDILPFCNFVSLTGGNGVKVIVKGNKSCAYEYNNKFYRISKDIEITDETPLTGASGVSEIKTQTFSDLRKKHPGMTAVLGTLYASILDLGKTVHNPSGSSAAMVGDFLFKFFFLIALIIPLLAFSIILVARVVILWMFIIISPIVFLFTSVKGFGKFLGEKSNLKQLCCMVFLPVPVVFALSLSFIFINALKFESLKAQFGIKAEGNTVLLQVDGNKQHDIKIHFKDTGKDSALTDMFKFLPNTFLWIIKLVFAIGFMWILVFTALKSCKLTSGIADSISRFSVNLAKATPIFPFAKGQSIASLGQGLRQIENYPQVKQSEQYNKLNEVLQKFEDKITGKEERKIEEVSKVSENYDKTIKSINVPSILNQKVDTDNNNTPDTEISKLTYGNIMKNTNLMKAITDKFHMSEDTFKYYAKSRTTMKISKTDVENMWNIEKARKIIQKTIDENLTIDSLTDESKKDIADGLGITVDDIKKASARLIQKLKELGFKEEDIKKIVKKDS